MASIKYKNHPNQRDQLAFHNRVPDIQFLLNEYQRSAFHGTMVSKMNYADDIRLARWSGQTDDGKKHSWARPDGDPAFPFEGASDVRIRLVDRLIREQKALLMHSFKACTLKVGGTEIGDTMAAASATNLMRWLIETKMKLELHKEAELHADYMLQYGWSIVQVTWDRQMGKRTQSISLEELSMAAQQAQMQNSGESMMTNLVAAIQAGKDDYAVQLMTSLLPNVKEQDLRKCVKSMRETGTGYIDEPYVAKNLPVVTALKPYDEVCFPPETSDLQKARVIFRRQYVTEVELRSMAEVDGWDKEFVESASRTMGNHYYFNDPNLIPTTTMLNTNIQRGDNLVELVWAYYRQLDKDNIPAIYYTVFCPQVGSELYGKQELLNYAHNQYPFVELRMETSRRQVTESRGIPEICKTEQEEVKAQHDAIRDRTAIEVLPPVKVVKRIGALNRIAPGQVLPVTNKDDYTWLEPPAGRAEYAFQVIEQVEKNLGNYFGFQVGEKPIDPVKIQMMKQLQVDNWLMFWTRCFSQMFSLCLQFMEEEEVVRITGSPLKQGMSDIHSQYDLNVRFDVRDADPDFVREKLKSIVETVVPLDVSGVIDRDKLVKLVIESISPDAARELVIDKATASQKLYKDVTNDIALMMLGNEAQYVENDPQASSKLQFAQDILAKNPKAQQAAQGDRIFQILLENYMKQLQFSVEQEKNKQIGRVGVSPASDKIQEEFGKAQEEEAAAAAEGQAQAQAPQVQTQQPPIQMSI
jgi:hypothetical protein